MLRFLVLLLVAANVLVLGYSQGWWAWVGWAPVSQREPERMARQVAPDELQLLKEAIDPAPPALETPADPPVSTEPAAVAATEAAPASPTSAPATQVPAKTEPKACWQAGGLSTAQAQTAQEVVAGVLDKQRWSVSEGVLPQRWLVYLGKFPSDAALKARKAELQAMGVEYRVVKTASLAPGLALSTLSSEEAANVALKGALKAGVKGARVVQERPETRVSTLKLPALTTAERKQVQALLAFHGLPLQSCP